MGNFYPQPILLTASKQVGVVGGKRRPGTAGRKAQLNFGKKLNGGASAVGLSG